MTSKIINGYALEKLSDLVFALFIDPAPAREKLSTNLHYIAFIHPSDFKLDKHQKTWANLQSKLLRKTENFGLERKPIERLTVRNKTLCYALVSIWDIYEECRESARE